MKKLYKLLLILPFIGFGQDKIGKLNIYIDGGTFVVLNSVFMNIETHLASSKSDKLHLYFRGSYGDVGVVLFTGGSGTSSSDQENSTLVGALTLLTGKGSHHFDSSMGVFLRDDSVLPFLDLGYRFQELDGGIIIRGKIGLLGLGMGIGYAF
tara:strand:+ start:132 stop:587 length:456 start_codon:yes stop_codon:yes gene_type:complete